MRRALIRTEQSCFPKKILVTGAAGFLGWNLIRWLQEISTEVVGTYFRQFPGDLKIPLFPLDITDPRQVEIKIKELSPDLIIHTAAAVSPAWCVAHPEKADKINRLGSEYLAQAAAAIGARVVYTSTDRVFPGDKGFYRETDEPDPVGIYGLSKLAGEKAVMEVSPDNLVVRLPLMYGAPSPFHSSFLGWMLAAFINRKPLFLFMDQYRTPALVDDIIQALIMLLEKGVRGGIYHLGGSQRVNRVQLGYCLAELAGLDPGVIKPILMSEKNDLPPTPRDVSLDTKKLYDRIGFVPAGIKEGLTRLIGPGLE